MLVPAFGPDLLARRIAGLLANAVAMVAFCRRACGSIPAPRGIFRQVAKQAAILVLSSGSVIWFMELLIGAVFTLEGHYATRQFGASGVEPVSFLVGPRVLASLVAMPFWFIVGLGLLYVGAYATAGGLPPLGLRFSMIWTMTTGIIADCYYGFLATGEPVGVGANTAKTTVVNMVLVSLVGLFFQQLLWVVSRTRQWRTRGTRGGDVPKLQNHICWVLAGPRGGNPHGGHAPTPF